MDNRNDKITLLSLRTLCRHREAISSLHGFCAVAEAICSSCTIGEGFSTSFPPSRFGKGGLKGDGKTKNLPRKDKHQVIDVGQRRAGNKQVSQRGEVMIGVIIGQERLGVKPE